MISGLWAWHNYSGRGSRHLGLKARGWHILHLFFAPEIQDPHSYSHRPPCWNHGHSLSAPLQMSMTMAYPVCLPWPPPLLSTLPIGLLQLLGRGGGGGVGCVASLPPQREPNLSLSPPPPPPTAVLLLLCYARQGLSSSWGIGRQGPVPTLAQAHGASSSYASSRPS